MKIVSVADYGAKPNGTLCTKQIQAAIDDCFLQGGGVVEIPAGSYMTGGILLRSNITLHLQENAVLVGSRDSENYLDFLSDAVEPLSEANRTDALWVSVKKRTSYDFMKIPGGRWSNGLVRAIDAENITILGEKGSGFDGMDCYDEMGEEHYRGPHGISMHRCKNIKFSGYTFKNSGNWAHALFYCENISMDHVTVLAGHDGIHMTTCDHVEIRDCIFRTGDDCVAGIDNTDLVVTGCEMNTACSALRLGGTDILVRDCHIYGPAHYLFRGSLSPEEKKSGAVPEKKEGHRYNMLSAYTYYADFSREIRRQPGNIVIEDCEIENADKLAHYNFSGNEPWQNNRPLKDITFRRIQATDLKFPAIAYGSEEVPLELRLEDCQISFGEEATPDTFMRICNYSQISFEKVTIGNLKNLPLARIWSEGKISLIDVNAGESDLRIEKAEEAFSCKCI